MRDCNRQRDKSSGSNPKKLMKTTKRIQTTCKVIRAETACNGMMPWESPRLVFEDTADNSRIVWHSDSVPTITKRFGFPHWEEMQGRYVSFTAFVRDNGRVSRVVSIIDL